MVIKIERSTMLPTMMSKSQFKPKSLEYLRLVEQNCQPLILTHAGKPVIKISPYSEDPDKILNKLRGTVIEYKDPLEPVGLEDWEVLK